MAVLELVEPSAAQLQLAVYNQNLGGALNKSVTFSVPAGIHWAVVGCVLADAATPASVASTLVPAVEALSEVTSVNGDQLFGQIPATVEQEGYECVLYVVATANLGIGPAGDYFTQTDKAVENIKPPLGKKWVVLILRVPTALDNTKISALEAAITGIAGVTTTEHLIDGTVSSRATANATLQIAAHMRLESVEV